MVACESVASVRRLFDGSIFKMFEVGAFAPLLAFWWADESLVGH